jgi:hypothetical protein
VQLFGEGCRRCASTHAVVAKRPATVARELVEEVTVPALGRISRGSDPLTGVLRGANGYTDAQVRGSYLDVGATTTLHIDCRHVMVWVLRPEYGLFN